LWLHLLDNWNIASLPLRGHSQLLFQQSFPTTKIAGSFSVSCKIPFRTEKHATFRETFNKELCLTQEQRFVTQLQYVTWPDHGIPLTTTNMLYLRQMVEKIRDKQRPVIVHCRYYSGTVDFMIESNFLRPSAQAWLEIKNHELSA